MNNAAQPGPADSAAVKSRLLGDVLGRFEPDDELTVLDLGPGCATTLKFFSDYRCRLYFADMLECEELINPPEELGNDYIANLKICQNFLALPQGIEIDVLLMWDFLHYLTVPGMEALSSTLQPHVHKGTLGYGFGSLHNDKVLQARGYGVAATDELVFYETSRANAPRIHSQQRINEYFLCLHISRATLLQEGHLELLFEAY
jgi:hypothetical protein